jgi:hypothetical protein
MKTAVVLKTEEATPKVETRGRIPAATWVGLFLALFGLLLHRMFASDPAIAPKLRSAYVVAEIDVDKEHTKDVDAKYGNPTRLGLPVIVVLDADGTGQTTKNTVELEEGNTYDRTRVMAFLNEWSAREKKK